MKYHYLILYQGRLEALQKAIHTDTEMLIPLYGNYAILYTVYSKEELPFQYPAILYAELSRPIDSAHLSEWEEKDHPIHLPSIKQANVQGKLTGTGTVIAILDSGVDIYHPDFMTEEGKSRILSYWDQTLPYDDTNQGNPYHLGRIFSQNELNTILKESNSLTPSRDVSGHGTHVAGISSGRTYGIAPEANLIVVKLKNDAAGIFINTAVLLMGVDYAVQYCAGRGFPCVVNLSYGTNYGSHFGESLMERFLSDAGKFGRNVICVATGNEGMTRKHTRIFLKEKRVKDVVFSIAPGQRENSIQIWIPAMKTITFLLWVPGEAEPYPVRMEEGIFERIIGKNHLYVELEEATPYRTLQAIHFYFNAIGENEILTPGIWKLQCKADLPVQIPLECWMPSGAATPTDSAFVHADSTFTITVPSTARGVISVGGYDASTDTFAAFSGQGYEAGVWSKPDLCAPAVNILSSLPGGGYGIKSGTSMAVAYVSGICALLLEYGLVRKQDPFLFGEKIKSYLRAHANPLPAYPLIPNPATGWGRCVTPQELQVSLFD